MTKTEITLKAPLACVILAAGQGTRMRSALPKVMHPVAGQPMIRHVVAACEALSPQKIVVVVAPGMESVQEVVAPHVCAIQDQPLGTGHAVKAARQALGDFEGDVIVLFGDTPLVRSHSLLSLRHRRLDTDASIVVSGFEPEDRGAYGRLIVTPEGNLEAIVEVADATEAQREVRLCNGGIMLFDSHKMWPLLDQLKNDNAKGEYYLTDCVGLAVEAGDRAAVTTMPAEDLIGINTRVQLAEAEGLMQARLRKALMLSGVTMTAPETVFLSVDTKIGADTIVGPHVVFGPGVTVAGNVEIRAFSHLEGVTIESGATIGPYARLRPGSSIGEGAHIGNFVEIKKSAVSAGAKINHLSYIGDASVGAKTNVGAGTITCNYDGFTKAHTDIGANVFVGSNTALVAPVTIGEGAMIAAGSTITQDVPPDTLAIARERQSNADGWAGRFRQLREQEKAKK